MLQIIQDDVASCSSKSYKKSINTAIAPSVVGNYSDIAKYQRCRSWVEEMTPELKATCAWGKGYKRILPELYLTRYPSISLVLGDDCQNGEHRFRGLPLTSQELGSLLEPTAACGST
jgi:hypothetical protein